MLLMLYGSCNSLTTHMLLSLQDAWGYKGVVRHRDPLRCAMRALAAWIVENQTLSKEPIPDPADRSAW